MSRANVSPWKSGTKVLCVLGLVGAWSACEVKDPVAFIDTPRNDAGPVASSDGGPTTGEGEEPADDHTAFCASTGPLLLVGDSLTGAKVCSGHLAERAFRYALCSCERLAFSASLTTDAFRSSLGKYVPGGKGGAVATNGGVAANDTLTIGGGLSAGGADGILLGRGLSVGGGLYSGGPLSGNVSAQVTGDAWVRGDVGLASLSVAGKLAVPAERSMSGTVTAAEVLREPVDSVSPCACGDTASVVDIQGLIANHARENHNEVIGLEPSALQGFTGERTLELPCGRFFLTGIEGQGRLNLVVRERTALFVRDSVVIGERLSVEVVPPGELDLFVGGDMTVAGQLLLGSVDAPARVRVYSAGTGTLGISAGSVLAGNLYAPGATLTLSGNAEVFGSVFVRHIESSGTLALHYDSDILSLASACGTVE
ncbi:hypothetical protein SAMN05443572_104330 [Myxococcus fulvus]|uniref:DUF7305 domain-containing protein n=1 Tax=Myxococcus fulvus TaxID=33 RepID=A0A511SYS0_MYXFU|nr:hypothetical protein [Myxococcus fulvus]GEN07046.1 hypothetical protein MFU01_20830 [Myxococcus fulvus]SEU00877.1 hypothetical protein SAMN05443572_104330 [Myxococcus fulvus]